jgi:RHS repeat-associated protein
MSASTGLGRDQGRFSVDRSGQATYEIKIEVPLGSAHFQPELSLLYAHRTRNGVVGVGWSVKGQSSIRRVRANYAYDNCNGAVTGGDSDRLSIDGQRLQALSGTYYGSQTVYGTEPYEYNWIQAGNSPLDGFTVRMRNGVVLTYGTRSDSRILLADGSVAEWSLDSMRDLSDNLITFNYTTTPQLESGVRGAAGSHAQYLDSVTYGSKDVTSANRSVLFIYEERPDTIVSFTAGTRTEMAYRLAAVRTAVQGTRARSYELAYDLSQATAISRVTSITELGVSSTQSLPSTQILWQDVSQPVIAQSTSSLLDQHTGNVEVRYGSVTGSGSSDLIQIWENAGIWSATTYLATPTASGITYVSSGTVQLGELSDSCQFFPADLDGSGRIGLLFAFRGAAGTLVLGSALSDGSTLEQPQFFDTGDPWMGTKSIQFFAMDANGDGRTDLVEAYAYDAQGGDEILYLRSYLSQFGTLAIGGFTSALVSQTADPAYPANQVAFWAMDVNQDGAMDLVRVVIGSTGDALTASAYIATSQSLTDVRFDRQAPVMSSLGTFDPATVANIFPVDANGDGLQDIVIVWQEGGGTGDPKLHLTTFFSTGDGTLVAGPDTTFDHQGVQGAEFYPLDFYGCGQTAIVSQWIDTQQNLNFSLYPASTTGTYRLGGSFASGLQGQQLAEAHIEAADPNGDGRADLLAVVPGGDQQAQVLPLIGQGTIPDYASTITSPLGDEYTLTYAGTATSLTANVPTSPTFPQSSISRFPQRIAPAAYPAQATLGLALHVVDKYTRRNATNRSSYAFENTHSLVYTGGLVDLLGRGWLGFASVCDLDQSKGRATTTEYLLDAPFTGEIAAVTVTANSDFSQDPRVPHGAKNVLLQRKSYKYTNVARTIVPGATAVQQVLRTILMQEDFDYGTPDGAIARTFAYDDYGNVVCDAYLGYVDPETLKPVDSARVVYRYNAYQNTQQGNGWVLGLVTSSKVTANNTDEDHTCFLPGDMKLERRSYDAGSFTQASLSRWDEVNKVFLITTYKSDVWGNCTLESQPSGLVTTTDYDPNFNTFPMRVTRQIDAATKLVDLYTFDPLFCAQAGHCDPNGSCELTLFDDFGRTIGKQRTAPGTQTDPNGLGAQLTGDAKVQQIFRAAQVLNVQTVTYSSDDQGANTTDTNELQSFPVDSQRDLLRTTTYFDSLGRKRAELCDCGQANTRVAVQTEYDTDSKPTRHTMPFFADSPSAQADCATTNSYDVLGRPILRTVPYGDKAQGTSVSNFTYLANGVVQCVTAAGTPEAFSHTIVQQYVDATLKPISVLQQGVGSATQFCYDRIGRRVSITDPVTQENPQGVTTRYAYDALDRVAWTDNPGQNTTGDPNVHAETRTYDAKTGLLSSLIDAAGATTHLQVDALGRTTARLLPDGRKFVLTYDAAEFSALGRLSAVVATARDGSTEATHTFQYDTCGNIASMSVSVDGLPQSYTLAQHFDPQGRLVAKDFPDGSTVRRTYTKGLLTGLELDSFQLQQPAAQFDPFGNPLASSAGSSVQFSRTYSPAGALATEKVVPTATAEVDFGFSYDAQGRLSCWTENGAANSFGYNGMRLASASGGVEGGYDYDDSGNILIKDGISYTHSGHFTTGGTLNGETVYAATQDSCGRTVLRTTTKGDLIFGYDGAGRVSSVTDDKGNVLRTYLSDFRDRTLVRSDADGQRVLFIDVDYQVIIGADKTVTTVKLVASDSHVVGALTSAAGSKQLHYYRRDHKGNITHIYSDTGVLVQQIAYDPFGQPISTVQLAILQPTYEARTFDSLLGLLEFGGRMYDPAIGRFITPDSSLGGPHILMQDVFNRFAFELNDPISYIDPTGHSSDWIGGLVIGLTFVALAVVVVATAGTASVAVATGVGALLGGGANAITFSLQNRAKGGGQFWAGFAVSAGSGALIGAASGWALGSISEAAFGTESVARGAGFLARAAVYVPTGAALGAASDVGNQFMSNVSSRYILGQDTGLSDNLGLAAGFGAGFGALSGFLQASGEAYAVRSIRQIADANQQFDGIAPSEVNARVGQTQNQNYMPRGTRPIPPVRTAAARYSEQFMKAANRIRALNFVSIVAGVPAYIDAYENWKKTSSN